MNSAELQSRLKKFALRLVPLCEALPNKKSSRIIEDQLLRSGFSAVANYRSAYNAQTKKAFNSNLSISLAEMDESSFWLEMIFELELIAYDKLSLLPKESIEPTKITGALSRTAFKRISIKN